MSEPDYEAIQAEQSAEDNAREDSFEGGAMSERPVDREAAQQRAWATHGGANAPLQERLLAADVIAYEARVVLLEAQRNEARRIAEGSAEWAARVGTPVPAVEVLRRFEAVLAALAAVSVADSGPEEKKP